MQLLTGDFGVSDRRPQGVAPLRRQAVILLSGLFLYA